MPCQPTKARRLLKEKKAVCRLRPLAAISVKTTSSNIQKIQNPDIESGQYPQGNQPGFRNVREYVPFRDDHPRQHCCGKSKDLALNVHHIESRRTGGNAPDRLVTPCEACHQAFHRVKIELEALRGKFLRPETFMGMMHRSFFKRLTAQMPDIKVKHNYGNLTRHTRIENGTARTHCADAFCIAGNPAARHLGQSLHQKQTGKHNRQIHKLTILKGSVCQRNQAPYEVNSFRIFDKVKLNEKEGFIFNRRSSGSFDVRTLTGETLSAGMSNKKLRPLEKRQTFLTQLFKEDAIYPATEVSESIA